MRLLKGLKIVEYSGLKIVQLYDTKIVVINTLNKTVTLNSGQWYTKHTKNCMNLVLSELNVYVNQSDFIWYVNTKIESGIKFKDQIEVSYA